MKLSAIRSIVRGKRGAGRRLDHCAARLHALRHDAQGGGATEVHVRRQPPMTNPTCFYSARYLDTWEELISARKDLGNCVRGDRRRFAGNAFAESLLEAGNLRSFAWPASREFYPDAVPSADRANKDVKC